MIPSGHPRTGNGARGTRCGKAELNQRPEDVRQAHLDEQRELIGSSIDELFVYDQVLETICVPSSAAGSSTSARILRFAMERAPRWAAQAPSSEV